MDEVETEPSINAQKDDFLDPVPDLVNEDDLLRNLQASWDPDAEDTNIDRTQYEGNNPLEIPHPMLVSDQKGNPVDDDLHKHLNLC